MPGPAARDGRRHPEADPHESASYTATQTGFPLAGWFSFQPLWDEICRTDPELFD